MALTTNKYDPFYKQERKLRDKGLLKSRYPDTIRKKRKDGKDMGLLDEEETMLKVSQAPENSQLVGLQNMADRFYERIKGRFRASGDSYLPTLIDTYISSRLSGNEVQAGGAKKLLGELVRDASQKAKITTALLSEISSNRYRQQTDQIKAFVKQDGLLRDEDFQRLQEQEQTEEGDSFETSKGKYKATSRVLNDLRALKTLPEKSTYIQQKINANISNGEMINNIIEAVVDHVMEDEQNPELYKSLKPALGSGDYFDNKIIDSFARLGQLEEILNDGNVLEKLSSKSKARALWQWVKSSATQDALNNITVLTSARSLGLEEGDFQVIINALMQDVGRRPSLFNDLRKFGVPEAVIKETASHYNIPYEAPKLPEPPRPLTPEEQAQKEKFESGEWGTIVSASIIDKILAEEVSKMDKNALFFNDDELEEIPLLPGEVSNELAEGLEKQSFNKDNPTGKEVSWDLGSIWSIDESGDIVKEVNSKGDIIRKLIKESKKG